MYSSQSKLPPKPDRRCDCGGQIDFVWFELMNKWHGEKCSKCLSRERQQREQQETEKLKSKRHEIFRKTVPALYHGARLENLNPRLRERIESKPFEQGLLLWGEPGRGKTYAMAALAFEYIMRGIRVKRFHFSQVLYLLKDGFKNSFSELRILNPLQQADVLILEDIALDRTGGPESDYSVKILNDLIDPRLENRRPTLITSNLSPENLCRAYGERISSRIATFLILRICGPDLRAKA